MGQKMNLPNTKVVLFSLAFGIVGIMYLPLLFVFGESLWKIIGMEYIRFFAFPFGIISLISLILGIFGLKSPKRKFAICGIALSVIALVVIAGFNVLVYILLPMTF